MTVLEWLSFAEIRLRDAGIEGAKLESQLLAAHILRVDRAWLLAHPDHEFNDLAGEHLLQRRENGEPLAYLLGWREFYGRKFGVDPSVLIPRHETETLVEAALEYGPKLAHLNGSRPIVDDPAVPWSVLDMGTGSGVLAITLKLERPHWEVTAVDTSAEALATASANARFLNSKVRWVASDGFEALLGESFDMIVSNPPYIGRDEELPREVAQFEPALALFADNAGLAFYERLAREAPNHLNEEGLLLVEIGHTQSEAVKEVFQAWTFVDAKNDLSGVERVQIYRHSFDFP